MCLPDIRKWSPHTGDLLIRLVSLAGNQHHIRGVRGKEGALDRLAAIDNDARPLGELANQAMGRAGAYLGWTIQLLWGIKA